MKTVRVFLLKTETVEPFRQTILDLVSRERAEKALRYKREADRLLSLGGAWLMQHFVGATHCDENGKPRAESVRFNISHSGDLVGIALCDDEEVGLDIEQRVPRAENLVSYCLTEPEKAACTAGMPFPDLYVAKESLGKAEGGGLSRGIREIPALPVEGRVDYAERTFYRHMVPAEGYSVSVTLENEDFKVELQWLDDIGRYMHKT